MFNLSIINAKFCELAWPKANSNTSQPYLPYLEADSLFLNVFEKWPIFYSYVITMKETQKLIFEEVKKNLTVKPQNLK